MRAALRGSYVDYVIYKGVTEKYPSWFAEELYDSIMIDESRYTFWLHKDERTLEYYEKQLIDDYSVILRKPNGEIFVTDYDIFTDLYIVFRYDGFTNSGLAAYEEDCIEYVECVGGVLPDGYPAWFYEYFTEALNYPEDDETLFFYDPDVKEVKASRNGIDVSVSGDVTVRGHCVFLRNRYGEIRGMAYTEFEQYYDTNPETEE